MIAVFDSGVGGISALLPLARRLPQTDLLYLADAASLPLGEKSPAEIRERLRRALSYLSSFRPSAVLIACGTASAFCDGETRSRFSFPIFDVIAPTAHAILNASPTESILLLGTAATVRAGVFARAIAACGQRVDALACPHLVSLAEAPAIPDPALLWQATRPAVRLAPSHLVLGCTHFSLLSSQLCALFPTARLWDAATIAAHAMADALPPLPPERGECRFLTTAACAPLRRRLSPYFSRRPRVSRVHLS